MLNVVVIMGRLTADPELKQTDSGTSVANFTLAVSRPKHKDKDPETDFIDFVAWRHTAEFVSKWFSKGKLAAVTGRIQTRTWKDKDGKSRKSVEVLADSVDFAGDKKNENTAASGSPPPAPGYSETSFSELLDDDEELPF